MADPQAQDPFEVPEGYAGDIGNPLEGEGIRLPFLAPFLWWTNGLNQFKQEQGPRYFGGWTMNDVDMVAASELSDPKVDFTPGWTPFEMVNDAGESYTAFLSRHLYIAVFGSRKKWDNEKNRGQYQVLGYMGYRTQGSNEMFPFGPVVLTAKSTASMFLQNAVIEFANKTAAARQKYANNLPISAFYACLGSFGDKRVEQEVGKQVKKKVTPLKLWLPEKLDDNFLRSFFVGREIAARTTELKKQSQEWLAAWKQAPAPAQGNGNGAGARRPTPQADLAADHMPEPPEPPEFDDEAPY